MQSVRVAVMTLGFVAIAVGTKPARAETFVGTPILNAIPDGQSKEAPAGTTSDPRVRRWGNVQPNLQALRAVRKAEHLQLNLFADTAIPVVIDRVVFRGSVGVVVSGHIPGVPFSSVTLISGEGVLAGSIHEPGGQSYDIRPAPGGLHIVRHIDLNPAGSCGNGGSFDPPSPAKPITKNQSAATPNDLNTWTSGFTQLNPQPSFTAGIGHGCDDGSVIDVMVVYTAAARTAAGGTAAILGLIDLAIEDANEAFAQSLTETSLRLVHAEEVNYTESGVWQTDGPRLVNPSDGFIDEVHPLRNQYGADCVSLWVASLNAGGIGYFPDGTLTGINNSGFTLLRQDNAGNLLFAHEIGHNLYCTHDRANTTDIPWASYSYGYREPGGAWHTIMAYPPGDTIPYFANPSINWPGPVPPNPGPTGIPEGQPDPCDTARTIREVKQYVANFRQTAVGGLPSVLYVRADATPPGNGLSWSTAFRDLQDALCAAAGSAGTVQEIWVKAGTYRPDHGTNDRTATFKLSNNLAIYGGFAGTETKRSQRDWTAHVTILSGDIGTGGNSLDNCYHVVTGTGLGSTAVLDGFTIQNGYANGGTDESDGGGGLIAYGSGTPQIANCVFQNNTAAQFGGAVYNYLTGGPAFTNCRFTNNTVIDSTWPAGGGAVYCYNQCNPTFVDCQFDSNTSMHGGAIANLFGCSPILTGCLFKQNTGPSGNEGGAVYNYTTCNPQLTECILIDNSAAYGGGMINYFESSPTLDRCRFLGNSADVDGGGLYNYTNCNVILTSCEFSGNSAANGGAMNNLFASNAQIVNCSISANTATSAGGGVNNYQCSPVLSNSLLWGNSVGGTFNQAAQLVNFSSTPSVNYCSIQGGAAGLGGSGNNGTDPQFVSAKGPDNTAGTLDDNPRLNNGSPAINSGSNALVPGGNTLHLGGGPRVMGGTVDRGAYEYAPSIPGDLTVDGDVDDDDLSLFSDCFTGPAVPYDPQDLPTGCMLTPDGNGKIAADVNLDGDVDQDDFGTVQRCYSGSGNPASVDCAN